jgi:hypothetical protein
MIMCIKTLRTKHRVVGLSINGKNFMLDKQICHALTLEETRMQNQLGKAREDIYQVKSVLDSKFFLGESDLLNISVRFNEKGEVDVKSAQVEFKTGSTCEEKNAEYIALLESFLCALNVSIRKQKSELEAQLVELSKKAS